METLFLTKLLLAHLLTDFIFQPKKWVDDKAQRHFASPFLYLHTIVTSLFAWAFIGWAYWPVALVIFVTHTIIDGWKSFYANSPKYFLADQLLHVLVILLCWWFTFYDFDLLRGQWRELSQNSTLLIRITAIVFLTFPSAFLIGQLTKKWREELPKKEALADAGKWIGIIERLIVFVLVLISQYQTIGLIIAAKSVLRFSDSERTEQKTEYLLIGTLISFSLAVVTGLLVNNIAFAG